MGFLQKQLIEGLKNKEPHPDGNQCMNCKYYQWTLWLQDMSAGIGRCMSSYKKVNTFDYCSQFEQRSDPRH